MVLLARSLPCYWFTITSVSKPPEPPFHLYHHIAAISGLCRRISKKMSILFFSQSVPSHKKSYFTLLDVDIVNSEWVSCAVHAAGRTSPAPQQARMHADRQCSRANVPTAAKIREATE